MKSRLRQKRPSAPADLLPWMILVTARAVAADGDFRRILPTNRPGTNASGDTFSPKVALCGNLANNQYIAMKCFRRLGYDVDLLLQDGKIDSFLLNRPFWEDVPAECDTYEDGLAFEAQWQQPSTVIRVAFDSALQGKYMNKPDAVPEVQKLYQNTFGIGISYERALLLAQNMGHWPLLLAMKQYDLVQLSGSAISLGVFCPVPYVVQPTGGDIHISPFEENLFGYLMRASYRNAWGILYCEINYPHYLKRLNVSCPTVFAPLIIDTDNYCPGDQPSLRRAWQDAVGGSRYILSVCRQSWLWKGNDIFLRGFAKANRDDLRLILMGWGPDIDQTRELVDALNLSDKIFWEKLCSKPVLRARQQAADLVVDQFTMPGYGTSVLESMAAEKPVLMRLDVEESRAYFEDLPPFLAARTEDEIAEWLRNLPDLQEIGRQGRRWVLRYHGYQQLIENTYLPFYQKVLTGSNS